MKNHYFYLLFSFLFLTQITFAQNDAVDSSTIAYFIKIGEFEKSIKYQTGKVDVSDRIVLNIPKGYKYIDKQSSEKIIFDFWGNPQRDDVLGMLVLDNFSLLNSQDWAFILSEEREGYVKDEDAADINYDDLLKEMQDSEEEINKERIKDGYEPIHTVGWASKPYYDSKSKILHWAKELKFGNTDNENTLNYDVRILGRNGLLSLNAVGTMSALDSVKKHIPEIIHIASFKEGHTYFDFDPSVDEVAAYTVGGLVAGKILAKAGLLALLLKNIKLVGIALIGLFSLFKNKILGLFSKKSEDQNSQDETDDVDA